MTNPPADLPWLYFIVSLVNEALKQQGYFGLIYYVLGFGDKETYQLLYLLFLTVSLFHFIVPRFETSMRFLQLYVFKHVCPFMDVLLKVLTVGVTSKK